MDIRIEAEVNGTEDPDRVRQAVLNLFPDAAEAGNGDGLTMMANAAQPFFTRICEQKIRDTARAILLRAIRENVMDFHLNKQAALSGKVNFTAGNSVLGDLNVTIRDENIHDLVNSVLGGGE